MISTKTASKYIEKYVKMMVTNNPANIGYPSPVDVDAYVVRLDMGVLVVMLLGEFRINLNRIKSIRKLTSNEEIIFKLRNDL